MPTSPSGPSRSGPRPPDRPAAGPSANPTPRSPARGVGSYADSSRASAYPAPVAHLIDELARLPGVGRRSAERLALHLLKAPAQTAATLAGAITAVKSAIRNCNVCSSLTEAQVCAVCQSPKRDAATVLVVEQPRDLLALEATGMYSGIYHVLLGHLAPMDGIGPDSLTIDDLLARVRSPERNARAVPVAEVILGLNPTMEGDGTAMYITEQIRAAAPAVRVSRLARGLPSGSQLEMATKGVLADAISGRTAI